MVVGSFSVITSDALNEVVLGIVMDSVCVIMENMYSYKCENLDKIVVIYRSLLIYCIVMISSRIIDFELVCDLNGKKHMLSTHH